MEIIATTLMVWLLGIAFSLPWVLVKLGIYLQTVVLSTNHITRKLEGWTNCNISFQCVFLVCSISCPDS